MALFNARSADRDQTSDQGRLDALVRSIQDVRAGIVKERRGLERRYADAVGHASQVMDTGYDGERDSQEEAMLSKAEGDALYARRRMAELDRQLGALDALVVRVRVMFDEPAELVARRALSPGS
jgi:hypothetical protein